jgi:hypothetical protein
MKCTGSEVTVYEYGAWKEFLLPACIPDARPITAKLDDVAEDILAKITADCRMFVFHLNLTISAGLPLHRRALVERLRQRDIVVLNEAMEDISKRRVQAIAALAGAPSTTATAPGDPDELLIVKTDYNYHGAAECRIPAQRLRQLGYPAPDDLPRPADTQYRIQRRAEIDAPVWSSPHWVVERFVTNRSHQFHRVYVAGDAMIVSRVFDASTFKKMPEGIDRESFYMTVAAPLGAPQVPAEIEACGRLCAEVTRVAHIDYAAYDVVNNDDGEFFLIDINTTPHWGDGGHPQLLSYLAAGILELRHVA